MFCCYWTERHLLITHFYFILIIGRGQRMLHWLVTCSNWGQTQKRTSPPGTTRTISVQSKWGCVSLQSKHNNWFVKCNFPRQHCALLRSSPQTGLEGILNESLDCLYSANIHLHFTSNTLLCMDTYEYVFSFTWTPKITSLFLLQIAGQLSSRLQHHSFI